MSLKRAVLAGLGCDELRQILEQLEMDGVGSPLLAKRGAIGNYCRDCLIDKKQLDRREVIATAIVPGPNRDATHRILKEYRTTRGHIVACGSIVTRGQRDCADRLPFYKLNIPLALVESKDNDHNVGDGIHRSVNTSNTQDVARFLRWPVVAGNVQ